MDDGGVKAVEERRIKIKYVDNCISSLNMGFVSH
eukprot:CAMPEP_0184026084 /NCGR_PEP_ID=MMETSP0954-20121128/13273_1 /TAXON_ID=627963 /ORGANISM="Aplanochytrium sp, Strain PBS07" /LENGTH=33 /DNA_ID= /DNA_START= /DNA_END= /DNA_ORIENTATION=